MINPVKPPSATPARLPNFVEPMKAKLVGAMPSGGDWIYEIKFDGYRAVALRDGSETRLLSRNKKDLGKKFPAMQARSPSWMFWMRSLTAKSSLWTRKDGRRFNCSKDSIWAWRGRQSFSMGSTCSGSTVRTFKIYRLKNERRSWRNC